ncbi:hypothetical protein TanjilG_24673 [Lupinus angustifolius]|uniref:Amino acid permease/ SLC12A domain-containing protein n=1 Tax=Lupinus angustifolius TaxID=3871 RepID=A0A4P1RK89_LUPAN|nr:hypothetical protein TanjilG_24673 [Lupinus angustifolius]
MESNLVEYVALGEGSTPNLEKFKKVSIIPLIFLIFYEVSGGPFGVEDTVRAAGPLLALIGFLVFPFIWSVPEALITAEMGEVDNPGKTLPKALFYAVMLVVFGYFFPLLIGTGAIPTNPKLWYDGYFSEIAKQIGGVWLRFWVQTASALSNMSMFVAEMSSDSFQLLGMAERGMLPEFFAKRSHYGTPLIGILFSASGVILLSWLSFQEIVAAENFLYCFGMLMEFITFVKLRIKYPSVSRPYKVPVGSFGAILMCMAPTLLIFVVLAHVSFKVLIISISAVMIGLLLQPCLKYMEQKRWFRFSVNSDLPNFHAT